jgi:hypothetical protein
MSYQNNQSNQNNKGLRDPIWQFIWGAVAAVLAVIAIIVGILALPPGGPVRIFISRAAAGTTPTSEIPTVPPATPSPTLTPSPTPTLSPTPTPKVIPENLNIVCLNCTSINAYSLKLNTITIDYSNHQTITKFTIVATGSDPCNVLFRKLEFQDESGTIFAAQNVGQFIENIATGNPLIVNSTFDLLPRPNIHYLLSISLNCTSHLDFKTQDFVFN